MSTIIDGSLTLNGRTVNVPVRLFPPHHGSASSFATMAKNQIRPRSSGTQSKTTAVNCSAPLRIEPNRIMWGDYDTKKWRRLSLGKFRLLIEKHGEMVEK